MQRSLIPSLVTMRQAKAGPRWHSPAGFFLRRAVIQKRPFSAQNSRKSLRRIGLKGIQTCLSGNGLTLLKLQGISNRDQRVHPGSVLAFPDLRWFVTKWRTSAPVPPRSHWRYPENGGQLSITRENGHPWGVLGSPTGGNVLCGEPLF